MGGEEVALHRVLAGEQHMAHGTAGLAGVNVLVVGQRVVAAEAAATGAAREGAAAPRTAPRSATPLGGGAGLSLQDSSAAALLAPGVRTERQLRGNPPQRWRGHTTVSHDTSQVHFKKDARGDTGLGV